MYPHNPYFGIAQPYYGIVGLAPMRMTIPPPMATAMTHLIPAAPAVAVAAVPTSKPEVLIVTREKPPVTTVFVGNIAEQVPDQLIKSLLMRCGNILSWKRVQGASGKLQAFGFCEYEDPESTLRCVRLLNGFAVGSKTLLVKVDPKTEDLLNEYKKRKEKAGEEGAMGTKPEELDSITLRDDETVKNALQNIIDENARLLAEESPGKKDVRLEGPRHLTIEDMDLDIERKDLINREIESFRKRHEKEDNDDGSNRRTKTRDKDRVGSTSAGLKLYSSGSASERDRRERHKDKDHKSSHSRSRSKSRDAARRRSRGTIVSAALTSVRSGSLDEEEESIRKKLERKLKEKEESYQERLKQWEARERKKAAEYDREKERERKKQEELEVEAQRLREFFEDYDDDVEDPKYYKGSALQRRLKDRELEEGADERDRQKEIEQIEAARRKLIEEGDPNAESIILQMEQRMQEHLRRRLNLDADMASAFVDEDTPSSLTMATASAEVKPQRSSNTLPDAVKLTQQVSPTPVEDLSDSRHVASTENTAVQIDSQIPCTNMAKDTSATFLFAMAPAEHVVRKTAAAFTEEEPEEKPKKHTPSWLPPSAVKATAAASVVNSSEQNAHNSIMDNTNGIQSCTMSTEEKKACIKRIIEGIPTAKKDLFAFPIDWEMVDADFVNTRIKPWVDKKIVSYIGEAEATLSSFICDQLLHHYPPERILTDIAMVLDEEAEVFVVKMWRLLIYVIAEKKAGLSC